MKHILVIDDEKSIRDAFQLALEESGYSVEGAATGEEGIQHVLARRPDLIFLDLRMPGMGGIETLRRLGKICPGVAVYVVTAFYQSYLEPLKTLHGEGVLFQLAKKPLSAADIREIAASVLEGPEARPHG